MVNKRIKLYISLLLALVVSVFFSPIVQPVKQNKHIPTQPVSMNLSLFQNKDGIVRMKSIALREHYPSDYQSKYNSNYYTITLKQGKRTVFTGQIVRSYMIISENMNEMPEGESSEIPLGDFELNLPYYKDATTLILVDDTGQEVLTVDLTQYPLTLPQTDKAYCGDGICADNEGLLMCFSDCSFKLKH